MSHLPFAGKVACFKCRKVYAVITADSELSKKRVEVIEAFTFAQGSTPMNPLLRCTCGFLTPIERGLIPHPTLNQADPEAGLGNSFQPTS